jgi:hypothetical protein
LPAETQALLSAVRKGNISEVGLFGAFAGIRKADHTIDLRSVQAVERMCTGIGKSDTPATNPLLALLAGWIEGWLASPAAAVGHDLCPACGQVRPKKAA